MWSDSGPENRTFIASARRTQIVDAAIDTLAEVGYANTSLARIAARLGVSKGVISYHFAGKDDLIREIFREVVGSAIAYMRPRIEAETTGPRILRAYIESNLAFMQEHPKKLIAIVEIARGTRALEPGSRFYSDAELGQGVRILADLLARFQATGEFRADFDPRSMAIAIRAAIDAIPGLLTRDPELDVKSYAAELATIFDLATRRA